MRGFFTKLWSTGIVGTFLAGLFVLLPIALTIVVLNWMVGNIASVLGPGSVLGELIASGGGTIVGANHKTLAFLAGLILALAIVWTIGAVVRTQAKQQLNRGIDRLVERLPVVRSIYKPLPRWFVCLPATKARISRACPSSPAALAAATGPISLVS